MSYKYGGTGDTFIEVDLPDGHGRFVVADDGYHDGDVDYRLEDADGNHATFSQLRKDICDDDEFIALLEAAFGHADAPAGGGSTSRTSFNSPPVFKCDDCNKSWPRRRNQTPAEQADTCPECVE